MYCFPEDAPNIAFPNFEQDTLASTIMSHKSPIIFSNGIVMAISRILAYLFRDILIPHGKAKKKNRWMKSLA